MAFCAKCGKEVNDSAVVCTSCGCAMGGSKTSGAVSDKSKVVAGILQLFFGGLGIGRFYMGCPGLAIAQIAVTWFTGIGALWPFIDGIMILVCKDVRDGQGRIMQ